MTRLLLAIVFSMAVAGCSLERPYPEKSLYVLSPQLDLATTDRAEAENAILRVARARVAPPFNTRAMQYRVAADRFEPDYYNAWADDPGSLIAAAAITALNATGRWEAVLDDASNAAYTRTLEMYVDALFADVSDAEATHAVLRMSVSLLDREGNILFSKRYDQSVPVTPADAPALVEGWNDALAKVLVSFLADLEDR